MPRYRFSWDNLPPALLTRLCRDLDLDPPPAPALLARYGPRPRSEFVHDAWRTLVDTWLEADGRSRERIVAQFWKHGLGSGGSPPLTVAEQVDYLDSCRESASAREIVAAAFRALGEPWLVGTPAGEDAPESSDQPPSLDEWLDDVMGEILGPAEVRRDRDGDIPVRAGSTVCYVRCVDDPPSVRLFCPMVVGIPSSAALLEAINEINMNITVGRVFHTPADEVIFAIELYGEQLTAEIIRESLAAATTVADHFDHQLQSRFGGKTMFPETSDDSVML